MPSYRRLSDAYLAKCEANEKAGTLTPRQAADLRGHRGLAGAVQRAHAEFAHLRRVARVAEEESWTGLN